MTHEKHVKHANNTADEPVEPKTAEPSCVERENQTAIEPEVMPDAEPQTEAQSEAKPAPEAQDPMAKLQSEVAEWKSKYTYLYADYDNYRRRVARDIQTAREQGVISAAEPILNIFDHFRMAMVASEKSDNVEKIREGLKLIFNEFQKSITDMGIQPVEAEGKMFDPALHEAISHVPNDAPEGTVIQQWSCGYQQNKKLVRPARVVVSSGPAKTEEKTEE